MDGQMTDWDNFVKNWWNLPISNLKPDLHNVNINAHNKFDENPLIVTQEISPGIENTAYVRRRDRHTDGYTEDQLETIIPHHYHVVGYKNAKHYENTPIQIHWKFYHQKMAIFQIKSSDIFHISAQNIDCGYSLELPRRGGPVRRF